MDTAIIDLCPPPTGTTPVCSIPPLPAATEQLYFYLVLGGLKFASIYVPLSRVRSLDGLAILHPFPKSVLSTAKHADLVADMQRLTLLSKMFSGLFLIISTLESFDLNQLTN
jgi:hypothetical protein